MPEVYINLGTNDYSTEVIYFHFQLLSNEALPLSAAVAVWGSVHNWLSQFSGEHPRGIWRRYHILSRLRADDWRPLLHLCRGEGRHFISTFIYSLFFFLSSECRDDGGERTLHRFAEHSLLSGRLLLWPPQRYSNDLLCFSPLTLSQYRGIWRWRRRARQSSLKWWSGEVEGD